MEAGLGAATYFDEWGGDNDDLLTGDELHESVFNTSDTNEDEHLSDDENFRGCGRLLGRG